MSLKHVFLGLASILFLGSCAHHRDVRAGADGIHKVVVMTDDADEGSRDAISQANHFCEERKMAAAFIQEDKKYTGSMKEDDYKKLKTAGKVAGVVGSTAYVFGGKNESAAGGLVGLGGLAADAAAGKGYTVEMKFKCM